ARPPRLRASVRPACTAGSAAAFASSVLRVRDYGNRAVCGVPCALCQSIEPRASTITKDAALRLCGASGTWMCHGRECAQGCAPERGPAEPEGGGPRRSRCSCGSRHGVRRPPPEPMLLRFAPGSAAAPPEPTVWLSPGEQVLRGFQRRDRPLQLQR